MSQVHGSNFDLAVLGGGPAGYVAAIRGAQLGARVALVEKDRPGGTCLNRGCIPTKALVESAKALELARRSADLGVDLKAGPVDYARVAARKDRVVARLVGGVETLLKGNGVQRFTGRGALKGPGTIEVAGPDGQLTRVDARRIIVATGSRPARVLIPGLDGDGILDSDAALALTSLPGSMIIIGGGVIGVEFAGIYSRFGVKVILVEALEQILPREDREVVEELRRHLVKDGVEVHTGARVTSCATTANGMRRLTLEAGGRQLTLEASAVLVATGRVPNPEGLEGSGLKIERGRVVAEDDLETNLPGVLAAGDVRGQLMLAHAASAEGLAAAEKALGKQTLSVDHRAVPNCIFSFPEVASIGLSEQAAREKGHQVVTGKFPFAANGKALAMAEAEGFVKVVAESKWGEILGIHIIGPQASSLIGEAALALKLEVTFDELARTIHPHPTLTEALMEASAAVGGEAIHFLNRR